MVFGDAGIVWEFFTTLQNKIPPATIYMNENKLRIEGLQLYPRNRNYQKQKYANANGQK